MENIPQGRKCSEMGDKKGKKGYFWAVTLNLFFPGLGHIYLGKWIRALLFGGISLWCLWMISSSGICILGTVGDVHQLAHQIMTNGEWNTVNINAVEWMSKFKQIGVWSVIFTFVFFWAIVDSIFEVKKIRRSQDA